MILASSAILEILLRGSLCDRMLLAMEGAPLVAVGAPTLVESGMVLSSRLKRDFRLVLHDFVTAAGVEVIPFASEHYTSALQAFDRFGKGRHAAALNFGDCLTYAVAQLSGLPLLFTGDDFAKTDIRVAVY